MTCRTERRVLARGPERELVQVGFADEHGAGLAEMRKGRRVTPGNVPIAHPRCRRRWNAAQVEQILDRDRYTMERAAIVAGCDFAVGFTRLPSRFIGQHGNEGVQPRIVGGDLPEAVVRDLLRGDLARTPLPSEFFDRDHGVGAFLPSARSLKSAARSALVIRASASSSGFSAGNPRRSASAWAVSSHWSIVMRSSQSA